ELVVSEPGVVSERIDLRLWKVKMIASVRRVLNKRRWRVLRNGRKYRLAGRNPPLAIHRHVAALIAALAFEQCSGIWEQIFIGLSGAFSLEDGRDQVGCEREFVSFARKGERVHSSKWRQRGQIVFAIKRADVFNQALLLFACIYGLFVRNLLR